MYQAEYALPICTAVQIGLTNIFKRYGVHPDAVVGHSSGEIAAAYASGALSLQAAIIIAYYRGFVTKDQTEDGAMASIGLGSSKTSKLLRNRIVVACENSPSNTTVAGGRREVESLVEDI